VREGYIEAPYNWGTNHAYNLSTLLFNNPKSHSLMPNTQVTNSDLDKLLQASERLQLADELTPVQIWSIVSKLDAIHHIDPAVMTIMFEELSKYSYCNWYVLLDPLQSKICSNPSESASYGAVISKHTFKAALQHFLGWSHEF
jgi:hypothetical protein